jgi:hypothetical protein
MDVEIATVRMLNITAAFCDLSQKPRKGDNRS